MHTPDNLNASRPFVSNTNQDITEIIQEKEDKIIALINKNDKLEQDCLKFQIQLKSVEEKLKLKIEKEYKTETNTSSNFILPSEFRKFWEDFANKNLTDCFVDFYDNPCLTFNLVEEVFLLSLEMFRTQVKEIITKIIAVLGILEKKNIYKQVEGNLKGIFQEYFNEIFESEERSCLFFSSIKIKFQEYMESLIKKDEQYSNKQDEFEDMITSKSFKEMISVIKKILLFLEFHDPPLKLLLESHENRKIETKVFKKSDCICVEGFIKTEKSCMILLHPPVMKNGFIYQGLKPIVMVYENENQPVSDVLTNAPENNKSEKQNTPPRNQTSQEKENLSGIRERMKKTIQEVEKNLEKKFDFVQSENKIARVSTYHRSASHHNLMSVGKMKEKNNEERLTTQKVENISNNNVEDLDILPKFAESCNFFLNTKPIERDRNKSNNNFNGLITGNSSSLNEKQIKSLDKLENMIHSSRSDFESNTKNLPEDDINHIETEGDDHETDNEFEFDHIQLGTDYGYNYCRDRLNHPYKNNPVNKLQTLSNSFSIQKKSGEMMSNLYLGSLKLDLGEMESMTNISGIQVRSKKKNTLAKKGESKLVMANSDKKSNAKNNLYPLQTSDRGNMDANTLTRTIEKLGNKINSQFFRSGISKNNLTSLSKTPKQHKPRIIGYSPRTNIHYIFKDKLSIQNNIIKVPAKRFGTQYISGNLLNLEGANNKYFIGGKSEDNKNSKNTSLSKEKTIHNNYIQGRTLEENNITQNNKYKNTVKGKMKISGYNSNLFISSFKPQTQPNNSLSSQNIIPKNKNSNNSYSSKVTEDTPEINKRKVIHKEGTKKTNKSIDRRVFTNAKTKLSMDELLSFKEDNKEKEKEKTDNNSNINNNHLNPAREYKYSKTNFLNIKYV